MLNIQITLDEESNFTGCITLHFNQGGVRNATKVLHQEKFLNVLKLDSVESKNQMFNCPKST